MPVLIAIGAGTLNIGLGNPEQIILAIGVGLINGSLEEMLGDVRTGSITTVDHTSNVLACCSSRFVICHYCFIRVLPTILVRWACLVARSSWG